MSQRQKGSMEGHAGSTRDARSLKRGFFVMDLYGHVVGPAGPARVACGMGVEVSVRSP